MSVNVDQTLRIALKKLGSERGRLSNQIAAIESALRVGDGASKVARPKSGRRTGMSSAARKAISRKMKAYWVKRKKTARKKAG